MLRVQLQGLGSNPASTGHIADSNTFNTSDNPVAHLRKLSWDWEQHLRNLKEAGEKNYGEVPEYINP